MHRSLWLQPCLTQRHHVMWLTLIFGGKQYRTSCRDRVRSFRGSLEKTKKWRFAKNSYSMMLSPSSKHLCRCLGSRYVLLSCLMCAAPLNYCESYLWWIELYRERKQIPTVSLLSFHLSCLQEYTICSWIKVTSLWLQATQSISASPTDFQHS